jgi:hypothetical protein
MADETKSTAGDTLRGFAILAVLLLVGWWFLFGQGDDGADQAEEPARPRMTGAFVRWEPVDDARGYAYFTITNRSSTTDGSAECTITVSNDFGNFGVDILTGEPVPAGEMISRRIAMDVDEGSFLINQGEVTDC